MASTWQSNLQYNNPIYQGSVFENGYNEVLPPKMYNSAVWKTSSYWDYYRDDMFTFGVYKETFALKSVNFPGHCLMFGHHERSYWDLPWRVADFGALHRNEASVALSGLTRVRIFPTG